MIKDGRQVAPTVAGIRADHVYRYNAASFYLPRYKVETVVDLGCGVGYGAWLLARSGLRVDAYDRSADAISYALKHYTHDNIHFYSQPISKCPLDGYEAVTMFEVIEHTTEATEFIATTKARYLFGSVPNENVIPFSQVRHSEHIRHYTPEEVKELLRRTGWKLLIFGSQANKKSDITWGKYDGRTLVFFAFK